MADYVHGYTEREAERLLDQSRVVEEALHRDTHFPAGSHVLEAGCGIGAQTVILSERCPGVHFASIDISEDSLAKARGMAQAHGLSKVEFLRADIMDLPFEDAAFDHIFICFVLEHLADPTSALRSLRRVLRAGGTITVIEGDHGSACWHPETPLSQRVWRCLIDCQAAIGGDSLIGRRLCHTLVQGGFSDVVSSPRLIFGDRHFRTLRDGFVTKVIVPMVETARDQSLAEGRMSREEWEQGIRELLRPSEGDEGVFVYLFYRATGHLPLS